MMQVLRIHRNLQESHRTQLSQISLHAQILAIHSPVQEIDVHCAAAAVAVKLLCATAQPVLLNTQPSPACLDAHSE